MNVDVDTNGFARGNQLRVRAKLAVHEPLVRGFYLKKSRDEILGTCFDFYYENVRG